MRHWVVAGMLLATFLLTGCSDSDESVQQTATERSATTSNELVPGYTGGCSEGFVIFSQNQFDPHGTLVRRTLDVKGEDAGLRGNDRLKAVGWIKTGKVFYPDNPEGLRGEVWFYALDALNGKPGWVPDAGVRAIETQPSAGNLDSDYDPQTQAAPQLPACELHPR